MTPALSDPSRNILTRARSRVARLILRCRGLSLTSILRDWPQLGDDGQTQYCNLEILSRRRRCPGVTIRLVTRHTCHVTSRDTLHLTIHTHRAPRMMMMMIRRFVFALPCECFLWVSSCHLAKQSLNARIFATPEKRAKRGDRPWLCSSQPDV